MNKTLTKKLVISLLILIMIFPVFIFAGCQARKVYLSLYTDMKKIYELNESLDVRNGMLLYIKGKTKQQIYVTEDMVTNFSTEKLGSYQMTISYKNKSINYSYYVVEHRPEKHSTDKIYTSNTPIHYQNKILYLYLKFNPFNKNEASIMTASEQYEEFLNPINPDWKTQTIDFSYTVSTQDSHYIYKTSEIFGAKATINIVNEEKLTISIDSPDLEEKNIELETKLYIAKGNKDHVYISDEQIKYDNNFAYLYMRFNPNDENKIDFIFSNNINYKDKNYQEWDNATSITITKTIDNQQQYYTGKLFNKDITVLIISNELIIFDGFGIFKPNSFKLI